MKQNIRKKCEMCGNFFITPNEHQLFCSRDCVIEYKTSIYYKKCELCGANTRTKYCKDCKQFSSKIYKFRFKILERDKFTCQYCGKTVKDGIQLQIDHIIPKSKGGVMSIDNLITSCNICNIGKSDILIDAHAIKKNNKQ